MGQQLVGERAACGEHEDWGTEQKLLCAVQRSCLEGALVEQQGNRAAYRYREAAGG